MILGKSDSTEPDPNEISQIQLPKGWKKAKIRELVIKMRSGGTPRTNINDYYGGNIPFVMIEDLTSCGLYLTKTRLKITEKGLQNSNTWIVPPGSILLSMYATIGETAINSIPVATNQAILAILANERLIPEYGAFALEFNSTRLSSLNVQSTQKNINKGIVESFEISLPPLIEQKEIARILKTVREAIEATEKVIAATKELKKSMMMHLFTYGPVPVSDVGTVQLKETEIGRIPDSWEDCNLGEIATLQRGNDLPKSDRHAGIYPVVGSNGIVGYHNEYIANGPGVFVGRSGSVGKVVWVPDNFWPLNTSLWVKDFHGNNKRFVYYFLQSINLGQYSSGVSVPTLNRNLIHPIKVGKPKVSEQTLIAKTLDAIDNKIVFEENTKDSLSILYDTTLQSLMTGTIRVKNTVI
jgi:type I restriction enzyme, S subunit